MKKLIDVCYALSLISLLGMCLAALPGQFTGRQSDLLLGILTIGVLVHFLFTLYYLRVRLLPIAYPALYRKDDEEL